MRTNRRRLHTGYSACSNAETSAFSELVAAVEQQLHTEAYAQEGGSLDRKAAHHLGQTAIPQARHRIAE